MISQIKENRPRVRYLLIATASHVVVPLARNALPALTRSTDLAELDGKVTVRALTIVLLGTLIDSSRWAPRTRENLRIGRWATNHLPRVGERVQATARQYSGWATRRLPRLHNIRSMRWDTANIDETAILPSRGTTNSPRGLMRRYTNSLRGVMRRYTTKFRLRRMMRTLRRTPHKR
jgi:hypothetical protein